MPGSLQFQPPTTLEYFATLVAEDDGLPLIEAAASIAQDEFPLLDTQAVLAGLDGLADKLRRRIPSDAVAVQRLRWLNRYFFQELGFGGNANDYYDPRQQLPPPGAGGAARHSRHAGAALHRTCRPRSA